MNEFSELFGDEISELKNKAKVNFYFANKDALYSLRKRSRAIQQRKTWPRLKDLRIFSRKDTRCKSNQ